MYKSLLKPFLFSFGPERAHHLTTGWFRTLLQLPFARAICRSMYVVKDSRLEREVFGLRFPNPVGLAAGFDKDATLYRDFAHLGFGFVEVGTVTPESQPGNPQPRMFRLPADSGLINRMGFNNHGVQQAVERLKNRPAGLIVGGNIGKNKVTPNEDAVSDYEKGFEALFPVVDYFTVNVSSPNTPGLRALQDKEPLMHLLARLQELNNAKPIRKPILLKIAPDLEESDLRDIIDIVRETQIDGVIATNTTISRDGLKSPAAGEQGGLSGRPVGDRSTEVIRFLHRESNGAFPIVGVGGIHSGADAVEKIKAGATLVQVYTGLIYEGPGLVKRINKAILQA